MGNGQVSSQATWGRSAGSTLRKAICLLVKPEAGRSLHPETPSLPDSGDAAAFCTRNGSSGRSQVGQTEVKTAPATAHGPGPAGAGSTGLQSVMLFL